MIRDADERPDGLVLLARDVPVVLPEVEVLALPDRLVEDHADRVGGGRDVEASRYGLDEQAHLGAGRNRHGHARLGRVGRAPEGDA